MSFVEVFDDFQARAEWFSNTADAMVEAGPEHFTMEYWLTGDFGRAPLLLVQVAENRGHLDLTQCGTSACLAGWLVSEAPQDLANRMIERERDSDVSAAGYLADQLGYCRGLWSVVAWPELRQHDPERYGVLNDADEYASAIAFLRQEAARLKAEA